MAKFSPEKFKVQGKTEISLRDIVPGDTSAFHDKKSEGKEEINELKEKLAKLQELLYAGHEHAILIVLQGMDAAGKDSTIRTLFDVVNPEGVKVSSFKQPTQEELDHDFLWRIHKEAPDRGQIVIFNRSHYESVLVEKVHKLTPREREEERYGEINDFERMLTNEGTTILKFYLHIDAEEQKKRFEDRLNDPSKEWKFSPSDLAERKYWNEYMDAYETMIQRTSSEWAPWYIVPSDHKWFRDLIVVSVIVEAMEMLDMKYPKLNRTERYSLKDSKSLNRK